MYALFPFLKSTFLDGFTSNRDLFQITVHNSY